MPRKSSTDPIVIGVYGTGEIPVKQVKALLADHCDGKTVEFLVPILPPVTKPVAAVLDFAADADLSTTVVLTQSTSDDDSLSDLLRDVGSEVVVKTNESVGTKLVDMLEKDGGELAIFWSDDDSGLHVTCQKAADAGVPVRSFDDGLALVTFEVSDTAAPDTEPLDETDQEGEGAEPADAGVPAEAEAEAYEPYTRKELEAFAAADDLDGLKDILKDLGEDLVPRQRTNTIIERILTAQERVAAEMAGVDTEAGIQDDMSDELKEKFRAANVANAEPPAEVEAVDTEALAKAVAEQIADTLLPRIEALEATVGGLDDATKDYALEADLAAAKDAWEGAVEQLTDAVKTLQATLAGHPSIEPPEDEGDDAQVIQLPAASAKKRLPAKRTPRGS